MTKVSKVYFALSRVSSTFSGMTRWCARENSRIVPGGVDAIPREVT